MWHVPESLFPHVPGFATRVPYRLPHKVDSQIKILRQNPGPETSYCVFPDLWVPGNPTVR